MKIETRNPATGEQLASYPLMSNAILNTTIKTCVKAQQAWQMTGFDERGNVLRKIKAVLEENKQRYATLITTEMGKPLSQSLAEIDKCIRCCEHYALHAENYLKPYTIKTEYKLSYVCYQPLGVIFAIMPWNFPFWQVFRFACPTLMAGNAALLSHAPITTGCGVAIEKLFIEAGAPAGLLNALIISHEQAAAVIANPHVAGVTLTGSEIAGSAVAAQAGKHVKKVVLELGGNDPYLVLDDADMNLAAEEITVSRMNNGGQVCIAAKRIIGPPRTLATLQELILDKLKSYTGSDPLTAACKLGPLAREDLRETVHQQVIQTLAQGAKLLTGGYLPPGKGYYYPATILTHVKPGMCAFEEEIFGPIFTFVEAQDENEAIQLANQTKFGLGAAIFTQDLDKGKMIASEKLQTGSCFINQAVNSDPRLPFGGIKNSGFGRELAEEGMKEFVNIKTIVLNDSTGG